MTLNNDDWPPKEESFSSLSTVKKSILNLLWEMEWVDGGEIFKLVQQTYYDRRIRELRESGWQIETLGKKYRLVSHEKLPGNIRTYPSEKLKQKIFERDEGKCQICEIEDENIQYDHKVPLDRQGFTDEGNLQLLCRTCNVEKRGVCKNCDLPTCGGCPYAYPELFGGRFAVFLDKSMAEKIKTDAKKQGQIASLRISEILSSYYTGKNQDSNGL